MINAEDALADSVGGMKMFLPVQTPVPVEKFSLK
jgi:hypothetical protein